MKVFQEMGLAERIYQMARAETGEDSNVWFDVYLGDGKTGGTPICTVGHVTKPPCYV
jgi:hypothetical protein